MTGPTAMQCWGAEQIGTAKDLPAPDPADIETLTEIDRHAGCYGEEGWVPTLQAEFSVRDTATGRYLSVDVDASFSLEDFVEECSAAKQRYLDSNR